MKDRQHQQTSQDDLEPFPPRRQQRRIYTGTTNPCTESYFFGDGGGWCRASSSNRRHITETATTTGHHVEQVHRNDTKSDLLIHKQRLCAQNEGCISLNIFT